MMVMTMAIIVVVVIVVVLVVVVVGWIVRVVIGVVDRSRRL